MKLKSILQKIRAGALTITEEEAFALARSWLARDLYLAKQHQELDPEEDTDTLRIMAFNAQTQVNELQNDMAEGNYKVINAYISGFLNWHNIELNPDRSVVYKRLARPFIQAQIEAYRNFEYIIFNCPSSCNWNTQRPNLREDLAHLVDNIKRRVCGIASAGSPWFSV